MQQTIARMQARGQDVSRAKESNLRPCSTNPVNRSIVSHRINNPHQAEEWNYEDALSEAQTRIRILTEPEPDAVSQTLSTPDTPTLTRIRTRMSGAPPSARFAQGPSRSGHDSGLWTCGQVRDEAADIAHRVHEPHGTDHDRATGSMGGDGRTDCWYGMGLYGSRPHIAYGSYS